MKWTFGIITDGVNNIDWQDTIVKSIVDQGIDDDNYEIIYCTENRDFNVDKWKDICKNISVIYIENLKKGWITKKKNEIAKRAKFENLCLLHDYMYLEGGWYGGFVEFGEDWDICMNKVLQIDGWRYFDWCSADHPDYWHGCMPYEVKDTQFMYVSGAYFCVKKKFFLENPLDENLLHGQNEDGVWSKSISSFWNLKMNEKSTVRLLKDKSSAARNRWGTA